MSVNSPSSSPVVSSVSVNGLVIPVVSSVSVNGLVIPVKCIVIPVNGLVIPVVSQVSVNCTSREVILTGGWLPHLQAGTKPTFVPHFFSCCPASVRSPTVRSPILSQLFSLYLILLEVNEENEQWVVRERKLERSAHTHCTSLRSRLSFFSFPSHSLIL